MCPTIATKERSSFERTVLVHEITIKSLKDSCFVNFFVVRVSIEFKYNSVSVLPRMAFSDLLRYSLSI